MRDRPSWPETVVGGLVWTGRIFLGLVIAASAAAQTPQSVHPATPHWVLTQATGTAKTETAAVEIKNFEFLPAVLTVPVGTTVTWTSRDDEPHTVTSTENVFTSPGLDADETFTYTFSTPGTYAYFCKLHPNMTGTIIVK
jgi:plastocyanin